MSLETFSPPLNPDGGGDKAVEPRVLRVDFGDGYSQRAGDGLNTMLDRITATWGLLTPAQADEIEAFFRARGGHEAFWWTPPHESDPRKFICVSWRRRWARAGYDAITAVFEHVADL